jgi:hypothetical protein
MATGNVLKPSAVGTALNLRDSIIQASGLSERLQLLLSNDTQHVIKTDRDGFCLIHWSLIFEHHQGILLLLRHGLYAPAFALLRPFEEAFLRSFLVMYGTVGQFAAIKDGTYSTEFEVIGKLIDEKLGVHPVFGPNFKNKIKTLHGFTHGGKEQLVRQTSGLDIVSSFTDDEVRTLVGETMLFAFFAALLITQFLGYPREHQSATALLNEYVQEIVAQPKQP